MDPVLTCLAMVTLSRVNTGSVSPKVTAITGGRMVVSILVSFKMVSSMARASGGRMILSNAINLREII